MCRFTLQIAKISALQNFNLVFWFHLRYHFLREDYQRFMSNGKARKTAGEGAKLSPQFTVLRDLQTCGKLRMGLRTAGGHVAQHLPASASWQYAGGDDEFSGQKRQSEILSG